MTTFTITISEHQRRIILAALKRAYPSHTTQLDDNNEGALLRDMFAALPEYEKKTDGPRAAAS